MRGRKRKREHNYNKLRQAGTENQEYSDKYHREKGCSRDGSFIIANSPINLFDQSVSHEVRSESCKWELCQQEMPERKFPQTDIVSARIAQINKQAAY